MLTDWYNGDFSICCVAFLTIDFIQDPKPAALFCNKNFGRNNCLASMFISNFEAKVINLRMFDNYLFFN
jgi:hypothetical protein